MKQRLDVYLTENGFFESREQAKRSIMAGIVYVNGQKSDKAGNTVPDDAIVEVRGNTCPYVSRGGLKLEKSIKTWNLALQDKTCMDIGASTGGFTDCMLKSGASKVYALDVGTNQLAYKLRVDPRVVSMEKTNIRDLDVTLVDPIDFISVDVSFISLKHVFPVAYNLLKDGSELVALVKPQFEAGKEKVGKGGVVKDKDVHIEVIKNVISFANENNFIANGLTFSPIKGEKSGNIEYLLYLKKSETESDNLFGESLINEVVQSSHSELEK